MVYRDQRKGKEREKGGKERERQHRNPTISHVSKVVIPFLSIN